MQPSQLPSNSLLITLSPPGGTFYLPPYHPSRSRSRSPSVGYTSDPELEIRKVKQTGEHVIEESPLSADSTIAVSRRRHRTGVRSVSAMDVLKTACWQDLFKFAAQFFEALGCLLIIVTGWSLCKRVFSITRLHFLKLFMESTRF